MNLAGGWIQGISPRLCGSAVVLSHQNTGEATITKDFWAFPLGRWMEANSMTLNAENGKYGEGLSSLDGLSPACDHVSRRQSLKCDGGCRNIHSKIMKGINLFRILI